MPVPHPPCPHSVPLGGRTPALGPRQTGGSAGSTGRAKEASAHGSGKGGASKLDRAVQTQASERFQGSQELRNGEGRGKWRWVCASPSRGWLRGKGAQRELGRGCSDNREGLAGFCLDREEPALRNMWIRGPAGGRGDQHSGATSASSRGQGSELFVGGRGRKWGALWGGALSPLGPRW